MMHPAIVFYSVGIFTTLDVSSEDANSLTAEDLALLRELGAGEPMLEQLRELARAPGCRLLLDLEAQTVTITDAS